MDTEFEGGDDRVSGEGVVEENVIVCLYIRAD